MLSQRLITGAALIAALAAMVFVDHGLVDLMVLVLAAAVMVIGLREFFGMTRQLGARGFPGLTMAAGLALLVATVPEVTILLADLPYTNVAVTAFLMLGFYLVFQGRNPEQFRQKTQDLLVSVTGFFYLGWTLTFLTRIYWLDERHGPYLFLYLILVAKCGDIGGYTLGSLTARRAAGNHKLVPNLSPKKSWEGFVGSLLFSGGVSWLLYWLLGPQLVVARVPVLSWLAAPLIGLVLATVGLIGDLSVSALKRASGVKDSGRLLPGMGGVLDVIDSLIFVGPLFYCYLVLVA